MTTRRDAEPAGGSDPGAAPGQPNRWMRPVLATAVLAAGAALVLRLAPGGLGHPGPIEVTDGMTVSGYRWVVDAAPGAPGSALVALAGEGLIVLLAGALGVLCWLGWRRSAWRQVAGTVLTGAGTLGAYLGSEAIKLVVDQERPCRAVPGAPLVPHCPDVGDWSFPSNHATIVGALAVGLALTRPRLAPLVLPLGVLAALSRVVAGIHYPHDVLAGLLLGGATSGALVIALIAPAARLAGGVARTGARARIRPGRRP